MSREAFGAESFERPVLVPLREGGWRLYLSCATPGSKHWWVDSLTADTVEGLPHRGAAKGPRGRSRHGREGPGDHRRRRRLRDVAVLPPARPARPRGPDDHAAADQSRRAGLAGPRRGARRPRRPVGRARGPRQCGPPRRHGALRRPARRGVELVRDHRRRAGGTGSRSPAPRPGRSRRPTPTAPSATRPPCRCPTAAPASTSRPRAPTARTTSSPACVDRRHCRGPLRVGPAAVGRQPVGEVLAGELRQQVDVVEERLLQPAALRRRPGAAGARAGRR